MYSTSDDTINEEAFHPHTSENAIDDVIPLDVNLLLTVPNYIEMTSTSMYLMSSQRTNEWKWTEDCVNALTYFLADEVIDDVSPFSNVSILFDIASTKASPRIL